MRPTKPATSQPTSAEAMRQMKQSPQPFANRQGAAQLPAPVNPAGSFAEQIRGGRVTYPHTRATNMSIKNVFSPNMAAIGETRMPSRAALDVRNSLKAPRRIGAGSFPRAGR
jgi:hypothetical protein